MPVVLKLLKAGDFQPYASVGHYTKDEEDTPSNRMRYIRDFGQLSLLTAKSYLEFLKKAGIGNTPGAFKLDKSSWAIFWEDDLPENEFGVVSP